MCGEAGFGRICTLHTLQLVFGQSHNTKKHLHTHSRVKLKPNITGQCSFKETQLVGALIVGLYNVGNGPAHKNK